MIVNYSQMSGQDKVDAAGRMYGTGSKQHLQAISRFSK